MLKISLVMKNEIIYLIGVEQFEKRKKI